LVALLLPATLAACGGDDRGSTDGGTRDGGGASRDGGEEDGGPSATDAGATDDAGAADDAGAELDAGPACTEDADCDDEDVCNGIETCTAGICAPSAPPACDDGDPCTRNQCDAATGCVFVLDDADGDGYAPSALDPSCGDCDDTSLARHPGVADAVCDGVDTDCDESIDEDGRTFWYADCDADGIPADGAVTALSCATPATPPTTCTTSGGSWTMTSDSFPDCRDDNAAVRPASGTWHTTPIAGEPPATDFDYNCDGSEDARWAMGSCVPSGSSSGSACTLTQGYAATPPACGVSAAWIQTCAMSPGPGGWECIAGTIARTQECH
jgi:hypothetical protein